MADELTNDVRQQGRSWLRLARRRAWTVVTFLTLTVLVVAAGTWLQAPVYQATATVLIGMETPDVLTVSSTRDASLQRADYDTYADYYRTQLAVITSRAVANQVFRNLKLEGQPPYGAAADPVGVLLGQVEAEPVKQTRLAHIHVEGHDPELAARIANEFGRIFAEQNLAKTVAAEALTLMKNEYLKLQSQEAELSKRYKAKHPAMIRVRQKMQQLGQAIEEELKRELHADQGLEAGNGSPADGSAPPTSASILDRFSVRSVMGSLRPNNIRVQDLAQVPTTPVRPKKTLNLFLGVLLGLLGGLGMAVGQELLDSSVKMPEDLEQDERLVLLGYVPRIDGLRSASKSPVKGKTRQRAQCVEVEPHSQSAESYRALRTNLLYAVANGDARAFTVTSPGKEEGKTTTVSNLGIAIAQSGLKVLLVDADLRKGRLHDVFQLRRKPGLSEFLTGQASFESVIQPTTIAGLSVVASGAFPPNPAELLGASPMREFLAQATAAFDRVLLDSPPIVAVTDAVVLAAVTGTVVAVAKSGTTPRRALYRLTTACRDVRAKVLGVILNDVPRVDAPEYYRYAAYRYAAPKQTNGRERRASTTPKASNPS
ncbi:MAG: polysaccharide biosynthesis tyrosine autokinase [Candidatus Omnitrophica bacterium]|nr:polysaccharide biosynthesis tyrosine autokinase [Candidatus Omnitrophota bacterium]